MTFRPEAHVSDPQDFYPVALGMPWDIGKGHADVDEMVDNLLFRSMQLCLVCL